MTTSRMSATIISSKSHQGPGGRIPGKAILRTLFRFCVAHSPTKCPFYFERRFSRRLSARSKQNRNTGRNEKKRELLLRSSPPGQVSLEQAPAVLYFQSLKISSQALARCLRSLIDHALCGFHVTTIDRSHVVPVGIFLDFRRGLWYIVVGGCRGRCSGPFHHFYWINIIQDFLTVCGIGNS